MASNNTLGDQPTAPLWGGGHENYPSHRANLSLHNITIVYLIPDTYNFIVHIQYTCTYDIHKIPNLENGVLQNRIYQMEREWNGLFVCCACTLMYLYMGAIATHVRVGSFNCSVQLFEHMVQITIVLGAKKPQFCTSQLQSLFKEHHKNVRIHCTWQPDVQYM